jgi:putative endonuclease
MTDLEAHFRVCHSEERSDEESLRCPKREGSVKQYYVYIMTNHSRTLYTGMTNDLRRRVWQHKQKRIEGFAKRYNITQLVFYEETPDVKVAIAREKQIKGWVRRKKIALIEEANSEWNDLSDGWYD